MKKIVLLLLISVFVAGSLLLVFSAKAVAAGENLLLVAPHSGGSAEVKSGEYKLWTIYGQPFAGQSPATGGYIGKWGAIWWGDEGAQEIPPSEDNGLINSTRIYRGSKKGISDIRLHFRAKNESVKFASIYRLSGVGVEFSTQTDGWDLVVQDLPVTPTGDTVWAESDKLSEIQVADGNNAYYRVVPNGVEKAKIFGNDVASGLPYNAKTVGKVDISLKSSYNAISLPFKENEYSIDTIIGEQLQEGDQIHYWNDKAQAYSLLTKLKQWPGYTFKFVEGFYVYLVGKDRNEKLTLVGEVGGFPAGFTWALGKEYNLIGYPYPKTITALASGLAPSEGDQIHRWDWASQGFVLTTYVNSAWKNPAVTQLNLGEGKFYYIPKDGNAYNWELKF